MERLQITNDKSKEYFKNNKKGVTTFVVIMLLLHVIGPVIQRW